jgi:hypothetical protein
MADRRVLARLRITPCGLFEPITHTMTLEQIDSAYRIAVVERNGLTRKQTRRRVAVSATLVQARLVALKQGTVPAFPVSPLVCDGEYVELKIEGEYSSLTLGWWTIAPEGAEGVSEFADWLRETVLGSEEEGSDE